jgi:small subunit ribosomal protein S8
MTTTDPIADMLTRIRNGLQARHPKVDVPASRLKGDIAKILKDEGYIANYKLTEDGTKKSIRIYLKYTPGNMPVISRIERVSRPGCRVYVGSKTVPRVLGGLGINILTTTRGVMTGGDRQLLGQVAANMRALRPPDPYKNKGIRYANEPLRKKAGKTGAAGGAK